MHLESVVSQRLVLDKSNQEDAQRQKGRGGTYPLYAPPEARFILRLVLLYPCVPNAFV
jgi:hypothetical protein